MDLKYDFIPDLEGDNAHAHQLRAVPPGSRVLELGCATGYLARLLTERLGCRVTGVELDPDAAERAREHCARVVVGDLDQLELAAVFGDERFDVVLMGDVLEHLKEPGRVLSAVRGLLSPEGRAIATIPNVAHGDVRLALLAGRFEYSRLGLLDDTHLRFFTLKSARALFEEAGFAIHRLERIRAPLFGTELGVQPASVPPEAVAFVSADPEATTYQFVIVASPAGEQAPVTGLRVELESAAAERARLASELSATRAQLAELTAALEALRAQSAEELAAMRAASEAERAEAERALAGMQADRDAWVAQFKALEARFFRLRRLSWVNPLAVADALWRRLTTPRIGP